MEKDRKPPENNPPSKKGVEVMEQLVKERKEQKQKNKVSIVNDWTDMCADDVPPKQIQISDYYYAFVEDENGYELWIKMENNNDGNDWGQVSDLTELRVWEYQEIKSYAVAIGWINEDEDLFI